MAMLSFQQFDDLYQKVVNHIYQHWTPAIQAEVAAHHYGWRPGGYDFEIYLRRSSLRFYHAYRSLAALEGASQVCDIGGFFGVFPVTLTQLGYEVTMTETLEYYSDSFDRLFAQIAAQGVTVVDYDPFQENASLPTRFDFITVLAVLEHYPHSLRIFFDNVLRLLAPAGQIYIEVPNIAYWPKRLDFLRGRSPLPPIEHIFKSNTPFIGHHHEYTVTELRTLAELNDLKVIAENQFNYSAPNHRQMPVLRRLFHSLDSLAFWLLQDSRECLAIVCTKQNALASSDLN